MQVRALGSPCDAYAEGFSTTHVSGAVIATATDAELEAIMTDIGIPAALRVQFRLIFAKWKREGGPFVFFSPDQVRLPVPEKKEKQPNGMKRKCGSCFGQGHVTCTGCGGAGRTSYRDAPYPGDTEREWKEWRKLKYRVCGTCQGKCRILCESCDATGFQGEGR